MVSIFNSYRRNLLDSPMPISSQIQHQNKDNENRVRQNKLNKAHFNNNNNKNKTHNYIIILQNNVITGIKKNARILKQNSFKCKIR